jgi:Domain of unknown function (DUF1905)
MTGKQKAAVEGVLTTGHKGPALEVPFDPATEWGAQQVALWPGRHGYPVEVLLNGVRFRSAIVPRMRRFFLLLDESMTRRAGARVGQPVRLTLWSDGAFAPSATPLGKSRPSTPPAPAPRPTRRRSQSKTTPVKGTKRPRQ